MTKVVISCGCCGEVRRNVNDTGFLCGCVWTHPDTESPNGTCDKHRKTLTEELRDSIKKHGNS